MALSQGIGAAPDEVGTVLSARGSTARGALLLSGALTLAFGAWAIQAQESPPEAPAAKKTPLWEQGGNCQACHIEDDWGVIVDPDPKEGFDHAETGFPLRGKHDGPACDECHRRGLDVLTTKCDLCHVDPHAGFNTVTCEQCHNERSWEIARTFAFHERTRFPLTGVHASIQCEACHRNRRGEPAATLPTDCLVCHTEDYQVATPNHIAPGFTQCGECHSTSTFRRGTYTHTVYQLLGIHAQLNCESCHPGALFAGTAGGGIICGTCHQADYNSTAVLSQQPGSAIPNHPAAPAVFNNQTCSQVGCHVLAGQTFLTWDFQNGPGR